MDIITIFILENILRVMSMLVKSIADDKQRAEAEAEIAHAVVMNNGSLESIMNKYGVTMHIGEKPEEGK
jgi:Na+-transporting methylmalonyl-CoA/oxaloacetate decarboxylase gamma subunit